jgi:hypothetical protein
LYLSSGGITKLLRPKQGIPYPYGCMAEQLTGRVKAEEEEQEE